MEILKIKKSVFQDDNQKHVCVEWNCEGPSDDGDCFVFEFENKKFFKNDLIQPISENQFFKTRNSYGKSNRFDSIKHFFDSSKTLSKDYKKILIEKYSAIGGDIKELLNIEKDLEESGIKISKKNYYSFNSVFQSYTMIVPFFSGMPNFAKQKSQSFLIFTIFDLIHFMETFSYLFSRTYFLITHHLSYRNFAILFFEEPISGEQGLSFESIFRNEFIGSEMVQDSNMRSNKLPEADVYAIENNISFFIKTIIERSNTFFHYFFSLLNFKNNNGLLDCEKFMKCSAGLKVIFLDFSILADASQSQDHRLFSALTLIDKIGNVCELMSEERKENKNKNKNNDLEHYKYILSEDFKKFIIKNFENCFSKNKKFKYDITHFFKESHREFNKYFFPGKDSLFKAKKLRAVRSLIHGANLKYGKFEDLFISSDPLIIDKSFISFVYSITLAFFLDPENFIKNYSNNVLK